MAAAPVWAEGTADAYEDMITDVAYIDDGDKNHLLDLFGTQSVTEATPTIIEVHGGGFIGGTKETNTDHSIYYAKDGYLVVTPDYSKLPNVTYKEAIQELFTVYQWVADHADEYHLFLTENQIDHEFHDYENQSNELMHVFNINKVDWEESIQANDDILAYFDRLCE